MKHIIPLKEQVARLPQDSGIYMFLDSQNKILYIGKAKRLRARLLQYINGHDGRRMVQRLLKRSCRIEITLTLTEKEALILEAQLIGTHKPPFNVQLLHGSNFAYVGFREKGFWPYPYIVRRRQPQKGERLFGPFPSVGAARNTLTFIEKRFQLRIKKTQPRLQEQRL